jgi:predicted lactoylglutathione lyase
MQVSKTVTDRGVIMTKIFVNIPTADLERSKAFYTGLGCEINPLFTDENAACVVWSDDIYFMVLTREYFGTFTEKPVVDPREGAQVLIALSLDSREQVDEMIARGVASGGSEPNAAKDYGFMYSRDLEDPDGNGIEFLYMSEEAAEQGPEAFMAEQGAESA